MRTCFAKAMAFDSKVKHYNYFRDYDPAIGRYSKSDPIGLVGGLNSYGYVQASPLRFIDPKALSALGDWIGEQWGKWWGGKPGDNGKDFSVDQIGRIQGAQCAKQCHRFRNSSDNFVTASEICFELMPGTQADILSGAAVLNSCATHCV